jgi:GGDEF domain-containing protein
MTTFGAFLRAFRKPFTYDFRRNSYLWLGIFWGLWTLPATRAAEEVLASTGLGLSAGIGCWPGDDETLDELVAAADRSLVISKKKSHESRTMPRIRIP